MEEYKQIDTLPPSVKTELFGDLFESLNERDKSFYESLCDFRESLAKDISQMGETINQNGRLIVDSGIDINNDSKMRHLLLKAKAMLSAKIIILDSFDKYIDFTNSKIDILLSTMKLIKSLYQIGKEKEKVVDITNQELIKEINNFINKIKENDILT